MWEGDGQLEGSNGRTQGVMATMFRSFGSMLSLKNGAVAGLCNYSAKPRGKICRISNMTFEMSHLCDWDNDHWLEHWFYDWCGTISILWCGTGHGICEFYSALRRHQTRWSRLRGLGRAVALTTSAETWKRRTKLLDYEKLSLRLFVKLLRSGKSRTVCWDHLYFMFLKEYWFRELYLGLKVTASFDRSESYTRIIDGQVRCITPDFKPKDLQVAWNVQFITVFVPAWMIPPIYHSLRRESIKNTNSASAIGVKVCSPYLVWGHSNHQGTCISCRAGTAWTDARP